MLPVAEDRLKDVEERRGEERRVDKEKKEMHTTSSAGCGAGCGGLVVKSLP